MQGITGSSEREPGIHGQEALQFVSANHLLLGHVAVPDGSNEIATLPTLLDLLDLKWAVVTIDAAGCQSAIAQQLVGQGADYVLALKGNQERLHQDVVAFLEESRATEFSDAVHRHRSIENSLYWLLDVAFCEDESRVRVGNAVENLALVRRLALHLLNQERTAKVGIKAKRLKAAWDDAYLLNVLQGKDAIALPADGRRSAGLPKRGRGRLGLDRPSPHFGVRRLVSTESCIDRITRDS